MFGLLVCLFLVMQGTMRIGANQIIICQTNFVWTSPIELDSENPWDSDVFMHPELRCGSLRMAIPFWGVLWRDLWGEYIFGNRTRTKMSNILQLQPVRYIDKHTICLDRGM